MSDILTEAMFERSIVARIPVLIKARPSTADGKRRLEIQASCEAIDYDGDVILQEALIGSANSFIATGHLDIDHMSEFGARMGIPNPASYIVGRPLDVISKAGRRTDVLCEISKSLDGVVDAVKNKYDEFWLSLQRDPPVIWYSSVYGFPTEVVDCTTEHCEINPHGRLVVKAMDWRSLAFTRTPKNEALTGAATIVKAKAYMTELAKSYASELHGQQHMPPMSPTLNMSDVWNDRNCEACGTDKYPSLLGYRAHLQKCTGYSPGAADVGAHALMHRHAMHKAMGLVK